MYQQTQHMQTRSAQYYERVGLEKGEEIVPDKHQRRTLIFKKQIRCYTVAC